MGILGLAAWLVLGTPCAPAQSTEDLAPFVLGLCARAEAGEAEGPFAQGAQLAADIRNRRGGIFGHPLELVLLGGSGSRREARDVLANLGKVAASGVIAPWSSDCGALVREACMRRGLPVVGTIQDPTLEAQALVDGLVGAMRCTRIGLISDGSPSAKSLQKELERRLDPPGTMVLVARVGGRGLAKRLTETSPDVLILDAPAEEVAAALSGALASVRAPLVLGSRAAGALAGVERELFFVHGLSPATAPPQGEFLAEYRARHGEPGQGAAEGFEFVELLATAIERAGTGDPAAVRAALATTRIDGPRGSVAGGEAGEVPPRLALWRLAGGARPHFPPTLAEGETLPDGDGRTPDPRLGAPFGGLRTDAFRLEPDTRWVRVHFGRGTVASIDADLAQLGLSTGGVAPFVDHLVREELLARTLSIVSEKYLRTPLGRSIPGQSLKVSFATHLPPGVEERETWDAQLAGADPKANGRAFPDSGHCEIFTTNWLPTVLPYALKPPIAPADLGFLDGTYVFGSDYGKDVRSELVRALVQGYASSLGLTTAHEVGHLFGLDHDSGDPTSLMSVDEERGLAPEKACFSVQALERLRKTPGVVRPGAAK
jgi:branched-chain amino acid transport system substrate-binding protein